MDDLPSRLRDNGAWTGDDALQTELRLDAAMEIERLTEIVEDAERRLRIRQERIEALERENAALREALEKARKFIELRCEGEGGYLPPIAHQLRAALGATPKSGGAPEIEEWRVIPRLVESLIDTIEVHFDGSDDEYKMPGWIADEVRDSKAILDAYYAAVGKEAMATGERQTNPSPADHQTRGAFCQEGPRSVGVGPDVSDSGSVQLFIFDRYRNGMQMAEGARVHAANIDEAIQKAHALFMEPDCEADQFRLRGTDVSERNC